MNWGSEVRQTLDVGPGCVHPGLNIFLANCLVGFFETGA